MENQKQNESKSNWKYWVDKDDYEAAVEAARTAQFPAFYISFSYAIQLFVLYRTGKFMGEGYPVDNYELYASYIFVLAGIIAALFFGMRIRKARFGTVPVVAVWTLIEIVARIGTVMPIAVVVVGIPFLALVIRATRGWHVVRQINKLAR